MRKLSCVLAILLAACVGLCGCAPRTREADGANEISLPQPSAEPQNMILGEQLTPTPASVALYFPASDGAGFSVVSRAIRAEPGIGLIRAAIDALLDSAPSEESLDFPVGDIRVLSTEYACGVATINLSLDARNVQNQQELLSVVIAIANTLLGIDGVSGVNVLIGGECESFCQLPLGVLSSNTPSVTAAYAQLQAERDRLLALDPTPVSRKAVLYFPAGNGSWLVPELRDVTLASPDFATALVGALKAGPHADSCAIPALPNAGDLLNAEPDIVTTDGGEHVLSLDFSSSLANYLAFSGLEVWKLLGSVAMTMCSFMPELDAVRVMVNGEPITICEIGDGIVSFPDGLIRRRDFASRVGGVATLYLADENNALAPVERAVSTRSAYSPRSLLNELFAYAARDGAELRFPMPENAYPEDLLGVRVQDGVAQVNLSADFYRACQTISAVDERNLVYSIVNTLCQLESVRAVRFYVEGLSAETLAGGIYLKSPLMPNPGVIAATDSSAASGDDD